MILIFGIAGMLFCGIGLIGFVSLPGKDSITMFCQMLPLSFSVIGGSFLLRCAFKRYKGEWPTFIGIVLILFGTTMFSTEVPGYINGTSDCFNCIVFVTGLFFLCGILLLLSGQRMHQYAVALAAQAASTAPAAESKDSSSGPSELIK